LLNVNLEPNFYKIIRAKSELLITDAISTSKGKVGKKKEMGRPTLKASALILSSGTQLAMS